VVVFVHQNSGRNKYLKQTVTALVGWTCSDVGKQQTQINFYSGRNCKDLELKDRLL
jgi:hypothetical protein